MTVIANELGFCVSRVTSRAVDGAAITQMAVVRVKVLGFVGELFVVAVAAHALAVDGDFIIGDIGGGDGVGAVAGLAAAHL